MSNKQPDPQKAVHVKPGQRRRKQRVKQPAPQSQWQPHQGDAALDLWGTALRDMRARGISWE